MPKAKHRRKGKNRPRAAAPLPASAIDPDLAALLATPEAEAVFDELERDPELAELLGEVEAEFPDAFEDEDEFADEDEELDFGVTYDPMSDPDPTAWLELAEQDRIILAERAHRGIDTGEASPRVHAVIHAVVETQVAMGDETPARATLLRLQREGLDRHDAVHAIGTALILHLREIAQRGADDKSDPNPAYFRALEQLTAESWRKEFG
jgi:hypothetical protein